jgi:hypothetical protein
LETLHAKPVVDLDHPRWGVVIVDHVAGEVGGAAGIEWVAEQIGPHDDDVPGVAKCRVELVLQGDHQWLKQGRRGRDLVAVELIQILRKIPAVLRRGDAENLRLLEGQDPLAELVDHGHVADELLVGNIEVEVIAGEMGVLVEDPFAVLVGVVAEEVGPIDFRLHGAELIRQDDVLIREAGLAERFRGLVALEMIDHREGDDGLAPVTAGQRQG